MKTTEELTQSLESPEPGPGAKSRRGWLYALGAIGFAVALIAALVLVVQARDEDDDASGGAAPTTAAPTTAPPATAPNAVDRSTAVWPFAGSSIRPSDPVEAAQQFATEFLGFTEPAVGGFQQGDNRSGEVGIRPTPSGPITTVILRQLTGEDTWSVLGAATANIEVTSPSAGDKVASPVHVAGRAIAFEGTVSVEVRQDGELGAIGANVVTAGGDSLQPFAGEVNFETPGEPYGALVFLSHSGDGQVWAASVMRVELKSTDIDAATCGSYRAPRLEPAAGQMEVKVYFNCDLDAGGTVDLVPVYRLVPESTDVLRAALEALVSGPDSDERAAEIGSWFGPATADMLRSVTLSDGHAVVDFDDLRTVIPNASSSAGSALLLSQLDATVFQFGSVESVEYRLEGNCEAFNEWLQYGGCEPRVREASQD